MFKTTLCLFFLLDYSLAKRHSVRSARNLQAVSDECIEAIVSTLTNGNPTDGFQIQGCDIQELDNVVAEALPTTPECDTYLSNDILEHLLGVSGSSAVLQTALDGVCDPAKTTFDSISTTDFFSMTDNSLAWFKDFYDGGTILNEHVDNDEGTTLLSNEASFVKTFFDNIAQQGPVSFPSSITNFDNCAIEAAMCCWVQDRQDDGSGDCEDETYAENCNDEDPGRNTDVCYADYSNAASSTRVNGGFAIYDDNLLTGREKIHCHGLVWTSKSMDDITRYRGNNLFYVSMYDHLHNRGYVREVPGAPMCGCMDQMPVATQSDCTQVDVVETFNLTYDNGSGLSATITAAEVEYNACEASEGNNDLRSYWRDQHSTVSSAMDEYLVGKDNCDSAITDFLSSKGIQQSS